MPKLARLLISPSVRQTTPLWSPLCRPQVWQKPPELGGASSFAEEGTPGKAGNPGAKLDPRNPFFAFRRETPSYFEGIMAKGIPKSLDAADLIANYHAAFHKSLNSRAFIAAARETYAANHPGTILDPRDIRKVTAEEILKAYTREEEKARGSERKTKAAGAVKG